MFIDDRKVKVKICGITRLEDARFASGAMVDYLGFIFVKDSPRYIDPEKAAEIIGWVEGPQPVGVFANESAGHINAVAIESGIKMVQLHGDEPPGYCDEITLPVIKAFRIAEGMSTADIERMVYPYRDVVDFFLFDTWHPVLLGGTGAAFEWGLLKPLADEYPFFLAGGLNSGNVGDAIREASPYAVDVSSSLETEPGIKDFDLISGFMDVVDGMEYDR